MAELRDAQREVSDSVKLLFWRAVMWTVVAFTIVQFIKLGMYGIWSEAGCFDIPSLFVGSPPVLGNYEDFPWNSEDKVRLGFWYECINQNPEQGATIIVELVRVPSFIAMSILVAWSAVSLINWFARRRMVFTVARLARQIVGYAGVGVLVGTQFLVTPPSRWGFIGAGCRQVVWYFDREVPPAQKPEVWYSTDSCEYSHNEYVLHKIEYWDSDLSNVTFALLVLGVSLVLYSIVATQLAKRKHVSSR